MDHNDRLRLDNQVCFAVYATSRAMTLAYRPLLDKLGLTYPQYLVMLVLWEQDGITVGELGGRLYLDSGTLTPLLKRLQSAGLVTRARRQGDEREVELGLTRAGNLLKQKAASVPRDIFCKADGAGVDLRELRADLKKVIAALQASMRGADEVPQNRNRPGH
ncbi:MAG: MarR family winged helix-turn-helix transcriptional regulator [Nevskiales bacterium]